MSEILYNGAEIITNSEGYDLATHMKRLGHSLKLPIPVTSQAQRDGLDELAPGGVLPIGTMVLRTDQSMFVEKWDGATWKTSAHCEWTKTGTAGNAVPTNTVYGVGALTQNASKTTDTAFVTHPAADVLKFRDAGTYAITFTVKSTAALTNRAFIQFDITGANDPVRATITGEDRGIVTFPNFRVAANEQIIFTIYHESGGSRVTDFRIAVTRTA